MGDVEERDMMRKRRRRWTTRMRMERSSDREKGKEGDKEMNDVEERDMVRKRREGSDAMDEKEED